VSFVETKDSTIVYIYNVYIYKSARTRNMYIHIARACAFPDRVENVQQWIEFVRRNGM